MKGFEMTEDARVVVTHGHSVTIAEIELKFDGFDVTVLGEARLHPRDKGYDRAIGESYAVGRAMTNAGAFLTGMAADMVDAEPEGCQCPACRVMKHWSDCAFHGVDTGDGISYEGPCSCGKDEQSQDDHHIGEPESNQEQGTDWDETAPIETESVWASSQGWLSKLLKVVKP